MGGDCVKKFWLLALAMLLSIGLAACGSEETKSEDNSSNSTESTTEESSEQDDAVTEEETAEPEVLEEALYAEAFTEDVKILSDDQLELTQESYDFIVANHSLFPAKTDQAIADVKGKVDSSITAKVLNKNAQPYFQKITSFQGTVISIEETGLDNGDTVAIVHVMDDELNSYQVLQYKSTGDILEEDNVQFWGVPVGGSSFENVSGGSTNVQNFLGSHIEKIN